MIEILSKFAETLLPTDGRWPTCSEANVATAMLENVVGDSAQSAGLDALIDALKAIDFTNSPTKEAALSEFEQTSKELFDLGRLLVYEAYYTNVKVRDVIANLANYPSQAPQPQGFVLSPYPPTEPWNKEIVNWRSDGLPQSSHVRGLQIADPQRAWSKEEISKWQQ